MNEEGGYLGAMTYQCLYSGVFDRIVQNRRNDDSAVRVIQVSLYMKKSSFRFHFSPFLLFHLRIG